MVALKKSRSNKEGEHRKLQARGGWKETLVIEWAIEVKIHGHAADTAKR